VTWEGPVIFTVYNGPVDYCRSIDSGAHRLVVEPYSETVPSEGMLKI
jgi:hypothetical protein